jgi:magnesium transporter
MQVLNSFDPSQIAALHQRDEFLWLELESPTEEQLCELARIVGIPDSAVEDSIEFGQRPKIDAYEGRALMVFYGAHRDPGGDIGLDEVHLHISGSELITIRRTSCPEMRAAFRHVAAEGAHSEQDAVVHVLEALTESLRNVLNSVEAEVDTFEEVAFERPSVEQRRAISRLRGQLFRLGQVVVPERDGVARGGGALERLPGFEGRAARHPFRDVHDDLVLVVDQIAYCRERLGEALSVYLASTSNRLNQIGARLTLVATIFLPITAISGFFGMNFGWLVRHIGSFWTFAVFGLGGMIGAVAVAVVLFVRAGYLNAADQ